jgi:hypothetical protein
MHSGRAHSLLLPVCGILIYPLYLFSFMSVSKNYLCVGVPCGLHLRLVECLKTAHIHTKRRILSWWYFYNFQLSVKTTVGTQMWQLTNQHRIMIQKSETGRKLTSLNELNFAQANYLPPYRCPPHNTHTGCDYLFIKLLSKVTPSLEVVSCVPCVTLTVSPMIQSLITGKFQRLLMSPVTPMKIIWTVMWEGDFLLCQFRCHLRKAAKTKIWSSW